jgi:uncharacterized protein YecE (DUF72 family)
MEDWAKRLKTWSAGGVPDDLPLIDESRKPAKKPRDVYAFFIHEGKVNAPGGAMAMQEMLDARN